MESVCFIDFDFNIYYFYYISYGLALISLPGAANLSEYSPKTI